MAGFTETFVVMQKEHYGSSETEYAIYAEHRAENGTNVAALQIRMQRAVRRAVLRADTCAELRADVRAVIRAEPCAVIRAAVLADDCAEKWQRCRIFCRNQRGG